MVMRIQSKVRRAVRLAPIAAGLSTFAFVAACARTNGQAPISAEAKGKIGTYGMSLATDYKASAANMNFAAGISGASIVVNNKDDKKMDATIRIVFADKAQSDVIAQGTFRLNAPTHELSQMTRVDDGAGDPSIIVKATCGDANCLMVTAEVIAQALVPTVGAAGTTTTPAGITTQPATVPAASSGTGNSKTQLALAASVTPAATVPAPAPAANAPAATAPVATNPAATANGPEADFNPEVVTPATPASDAANAETSASGKTWTMVACDAIVFSVDQRATKSETVSAKATRERNLVVIQSGEAQGQKPGSILMRYEDAFLAKYGKAAPAIATTSATGVDVDALKGLGSAADAVGAAVGSAAASTANAAKNLAPAASAAASAVGNTAASAASNATKAASSAASNATNAVVPAASSAASSAASAASSAAGSAQN